MFTVCAYDSEPNVCDAAVTVLTPGPGYDLPTATLSCSVS